MLTHYSNTNFYLLNVESEDKAKQYADEIKEFVIVDEIDDVVKIKALIYILKATILDSNMTNCEVVLMLEKLRSSVLLERKKMNEML